MKQLWIILLLAALILCACGVGEVTTEPEVKGADLVRTDGIREIRVSHLPESDTYRRTYIRPEKIRAVADYLAGLTLTGNIPENQYTGGCWVITCCYDDGTEVTLYHSGNILFWAGDGVWREMEYEQAQAFSDLIWQYPSD